MTSSFEIDVVASSTAPCNLGTRVSLTDQIVAKEGFCLAVRALAGNDKYNIVETSKGGFCKIEPGMTVVGTLGSREALKGFRGHTPASIAVGDVLHLLNMGGILGLCTAGHPSKGDPIPVEVIGAVIDTTSPDLGPANIQQYALTPRISLTKSAPIITVCGTAMDTGKTKAATEIVAGLTKAGFRVAAAKLTGAALLRDVRDMQTHGAIEVATFSECGFVSSTGQQIVPHSKAVLAKLNEAQPDVIVVELGDGFIGPYGVDDFLLDRELTGITGATVVAATDLAGAWAATRLFSERYRRKITAMTGPVTDNAVGSEYISGSLGVRAHNALKDSAGLTAAVLGALASKQQQMAAKQQLVA
ncbi:MAG: hypothetical protein ACC655_01320 [Rhodothermia bacterium]